MAKHSTTRSPIPRQTVVRHAPSGRFGVVIDDFFGCCAPYETFVVFDGSQVGRGTLTAELEVIGPENAQADWEGCGAKLAKEFTCVFFAVGRDGPKCHRFGIARETQLFLVKGQQYHPRKLYPGCQVYR